LNSMSVAAFSLLSLSLVEAGYGILGAYNGLDERFWCQRRAG
jgi:hypothetical protein